MSRASLARSHPVVNLQTLNSLDSDQLRIAVRALANGVHFKQVMIDKLTHENAGRGDPRAVKRADHEPGPLGAAQRPRSLRPPS